MADIPIQPRSTVNTDWALPVPAPAADPARKAAGQPEHDTITLSRTSHETSLHDLARSAQPAASRNAGPKDALVEALLAKVPSADRAAAKTAIPAILDAAKKTGNSDPNRLGYLLATAQTESDFGANMVETGHTKDWFNAHYGCEDGNRPGSDDGYRYRGRGYVQTTHAGRYAEISRQLGLPNIPTVEAGKVRLEPALVAHPEKLTEPRLAAQALVIGVERNLFTQNPAAALDTTIPVGKKPGQVDFYHARGIVNGIVKDQAEAVARHATAYAQILANYRHSVLDAVEPQ